MVRGYRHTICASVNEQVVHGIPGDRVLEPGDIVSIDAGAEYKGWNGDSAFSVVLPDAVAARRRRRAAAAVGCDRGLAVGRHRGARHRVAPRRDRRGRAGLHRGERARRRATASCASTSATASGARCTRRRRCSTTGSPTLVPRCGRASSLAIEPMVVIGDQATFVEDDDWTVSTLDGTAGSHWEHSVAVHDGRHLGAHRTRRRRRRPRAVRRDTAQRSRREDDMADRGTQGQLVRDLGERRGRRGARRRRRSSS